MYKVYIDGVNHKLEDMFLSNGWELVDSIDDCNLICLFGTGEVAPELIGKKRFETHGYGNISQQFKMIYRYHESSRLGVPVCGSGTAGKLLHAISYGEDWIKEDDQDIFFMDWGYDIVGCCEEIEKESEKNQKEYLGMLCEIVEKTF